MYEIIKRALDEALTRKYADEIQIVEEADHIFTPDFDREMRGLARRTDRPYLKYMRFIAAAACAVIAIGCAVLLPNLLRANIPTEPDVTSLTEMTVPTEPSEPPSSEQNTTDSTEKTEQSEPTVSESGDEYVDNAEDTTGESILEEEAGDDVIDEPDDGGDDTASEETQDNDTGEVTGDSDDVPLFEDSPADGESPADEENPTVGGGADDDDTVVDDSDDDTAVDDSDDDTAIDDSDDDTAGIDDAIDDSDDDAAIDDSDDDTAIDDSDDDTASDDSCDDTASDDDADYDGDDDTAGDDDVIDEGDDDTTLDDSDDTAGDDDAAGDDTASNDDADYDGTTSDDDADYDDTSGDDDAAPPSPIKPKPEIPANSTLGDEVRTLIGCPLSESYLHNGKITNNGMIYELPVLGISPETYRNAELAALLEGAELTEKPEDPGEKKISAEIGNFPPNLSEGAEFDFSGRNSYQSKFFGADEEDDMDVEDNQDDPEETLRSCNIIIYGSGVIEISSGEYMGSSFYRMSGEASSEFMSAALAKFSKTEFNTVNDLRESVIRSSSSELVNIRAAISQCYDLNMGRNIDDGTFIDELLKKYSSEPLTEITDEASAYNAGKGDILVKLHMSSSSELKNLDIWFFGDGTAVAKAGKWYSFKVDSSEYKAIIAEVCRQDGLAPPVFYSSLYEYVKDKNFTKMERFELEADGGVYVLNGSDDEEKLEKMRKLIMSNAESCAYDMPHEYIDFNNDIGIFSMSGWADPVKLWEKNGVRYMSIGFINGSYFIVPDSVYGEILDYARENGKFETAGEDVTSDILKDD